MAGQVTEKFGLYVEDLNSCAATKNSTVLATDKGKLEKLVDAKVLLPAVFFHGFTG